MRTRKRRMWLPVSEVDAVLFVLVLVFVAVSGAILWLSPKWWSSYITMLDVRVWTPAKAVVLGIVLMQCLLVVRLWPKQR